MDRFAVIAGLPRSGSTLLCNLLAQHPDVHVSSTSALPIMLGQVSQLMTNSEEITADLLNVEGARDRNVGVLRAIIDAWYPGHDDKLVIDKSRGWGRLALLLVRVVPDARILATVRHPCDVFESIERQHRATAEYGPHDLLMPKAEAMFSPDGLIGGPISAVEDMVRRQPLTEDRSPALLCVMYESLASAPPATMREVERHLGLEPFEYDFVNVESVATDADALYRFKFPHEGSGKVQPAPSEGLVPDDLQELIAERWPFFHKVFGYT